MRVTAVTCDRCGVEVIESASVVEVSQVKGFADAVVAGTVQPNPCVHQTTQSVRKRPPGGTEEATVGDIAFARNPPVVPTRSRRAYGGLSGPRRCWQAQGGLFIGQSQRRLLSDPGWPGMPRPARPRT
jgi:hypothetical protein